jgi:hypothetical protein
MQLKLATKIAIRNKIAITDKKKKYKARKTRKNW